MSLGDSGYASNLPRLPPPPRASQHIPNTPFKSSTSMFVNECSYCNNCIILTTKTLNKSTIQIKLSFFTKAVYLSK